MELKGIAALSNLKACHQAKQNVMMLKSKDFGDFNKPGSYEQPLKCYNHVQKFFEKA